MKVIWSNFASDNLSEIYKYFKEVSGEPVAQSILSNLFSSAEQLKTHPDSGQIEETLTSLNDGHRYIFSDNYKIVYKRVGEGILITDVFDTWKE